MRATGVAKAGIPAVRLTPVPYTEILPQIQQLQTGITNRAYELFEARGHEHGHDWEDWFRAESELLRPILIAVSESKQRISLRINVVGFEPQDLKISVEPWRVTILGKRAALRQAEYPDQTYRVIELPSEVNPEAAAIAFESGVVKVELFRADPSGRK